MQVPGSGVKGRPPNPGTRTPSREVLQAQKETTPPTPVSKVGTSQPSFFMQVVSGGPDFRDEMNIQADV